MMNNKSSHYAFAQGRLITKQTFCQTQFQRPADYKHTILPSPDEYHIEAIKRFKKQLDEMRRNYEELRRAYWYLLGYRIEGDERVPRLQMPKDKNYLCVTQGSEYNEHSHLNVSVSDINEAISDIEENKRKIDKLTDKMTQSIIEYRNDSLLKPSNEYYGLIRSARNSKTKTQNDEEIEDQLSYALKQNKTLKDTLEKTRLNFDTQSRQIKQSYEELLRKLEEILERERRHNKMLNGVIERLRSELSSKDNFIRSIMKLKGGDKNALDKLIKQFKIST